MKNKHAKKRQNKHRIKMLKVQRDIKKYDKKEATKQAVKEKQHV